jgi:EAL domain-containing protein (putative c-di-GMP-specific phosphodiesterase class I)
VADVALALDLAGLRPNLLCVEITESALMTDFEGSCAALEAMKRLGVFVAVDDFGTGYASLRYVRQLPVDVLKVDQSFVAGLGRSSADSAIVAGVVSLARALGMFAIAEGVETTEQLDELVRLDCELAQGWRWAHAMPAPEFEQWVADFEERQSSEAASPV